MIPEPVPCKTCKHYRGIIQPDGTEASERLVCAAFPKGIPREISSGENMHKNPYPGDHGIQYEKGKGGGEENTANVWSALPLGPWQEMPVRGGDL